jgi:hypothetical protein
MKNVVFWNVKPHGSYKNRCFGVMYRLHHQGDKNRRARNSVSRNQEPKLRLLVTANVAPSSPIPVIMKMEAILLSETSVLTTATRRNIPEDGILLKRYSFLTEPARLQYSYQYTHRNATYGNNRGRSVT